MELIVVLLLVGVGVLIGILIDRSFTNKNTIYGIIEVDHFMDECKVHITSDDLRDVRKKRAVFMLDHNGKFSRD